MFRDATPHIPSQGLLSYIRMGLSLRALQKIVLRNRFTFGVWKHMGDGDGQDPKHVFLISLLADPLLSSRYIF